MSLEMRQGQEIEQKQFLSPEMRLEISQEMILKMTDEIEGIRNETIGNPLDLLSKTIKYILQSVEDPKLREGLQFVFDDNAILNEMLKRATGLSVKNEQAIKDVVTNYIYNSKQGGFEIGVPIIKNGISERVDIPLSIFGDALNNPEKVKKEIKDLERIVEQNRDNPSAIADTPRHIGEYREALTAADAFQDYAKMLEISMGYILSVKHDKNSKLPEVQDFLRETVVLEKLKHTLSERIQKRFASRFSKITKNENEVSLRNAFMNTISEYVLTSMGVIDPEIFALKKADIDEKGVDELRQEFASDGLNLDKILKHYSLSPAGTIFWNHWNTLEQIPGRITDDSIRLFITETVRADEKGLLEVLNFPVFFKEIKGIVGECGNKVEERKDLVINLRKELTDLFSKESVRESLVKMIKEQWYPKLITFYEHII